MDHIFVSAKSLWKGPTKLSSINDAIESALDVRLKPGRFSSNEIKYVTENSPTIVLNTLSTMGYQMMGMTSSTTKELQVQYPLFVWTLGKKVDANQTTLPPSYLSAVTGASSGSKNGPLF